MHEAVFKTVKESLANLVPVMPVLGRNYSTSDLYKDTIAGATVAAILVPQAMAYALLAGVPPVHGLYAGLLGGIAGAVWSNSRHLATGPIALVSLLTLTAVAPLAPVGSPAFIVLVSALALMVGVIQLAVGGLRLGFLARLVPQSVLTGFSAAAAMVIILTQLPHVFGFAVSSGDFAFMQILNFIRHIHLIHPLTFVCGAVAFGLLVSLKRLFPRVPAPLVLVLAGIFCSYAFGLEALGVKVAGTIPPGLPVTDVPSVSPSLLLSLGSNALMIALVSFMSSYAVMKDMSLRVRQKVDADQELIAQGFANIFSGFFKGIPVGGSLSRTAVNVHAGAVTAWSMVIASLFVLCALFFGSFLAYMPNAVLAVIVIAAVSPLIDLTQFKKLYTITTTDATIALATFLGVFFLRPDEALLLGVALALLLYLRRVVWAETTEVGIHPQWHTMHIRESFPEVPVHPHTLMLRIDAPLFYANVERLSIDIEKKIADAERLRGDRVYTLVLDFSGVTHIDATGVNDFMSFLHELSGRHIDTCIVSLKKVAEDTLRRAGVLSQLRVMHNVSELKLALSQRPTHSDRVI